MRGERIAHGVGVPFLRQVDMGNLPERMHTGIGASRAVDADALAGERRDRIGQHALHRPVRGLDLPADEGRPVVFDGELIARHVF